MKRFLFGVAAFITSTALAQTPAPAPAAASASAAPAAASASAAPAPAASTSPFNPPADLHPGGDKPAVDPTADYPQPPLDTHEKDVPRDTQMGRVAVAGAPGGAYYYPPVPEDPKLPTLWVIGDSTVRNGTLGNGLSNYNEWGWGAPLIGYFDMKKINVVNRAYGGTTSHSFYDGFFWKNLQPQIKKGDFVILQFGANDGRTPVGTDDSVNAQGLHTFGWYLKQFVKETRAQGGTCIICSLTPRKTWVGDKMQDVNNHVDQAAHAAQEANAPYIDLHELIQLKYDALGKTAVDHLYVPWPSAKNPKGEGLHTGWDGAVVNAECVVGGIKALKDLPLAGFLSDKAKAVAPADSKCVAENPAPAQPPAATSAAAAPVK